jgi:subtilisin family serine protease
MTMATAPNPSFDLNASPDALLEAAIETNQIPYTGRQIVTFKEDMSVPDMATEMQAFGPAATSSDFGNESVSSDDLGDASSLILENLNVAIMVSAPLGGGQAGAAVLTESVDDFDSPYTIEPETFVFPAQAGPPFADTPAETWGLSATNVSQSAYSGQGIKVAVLDTGMDLEHPDFAGRNIQSMSFIPGQSAQDLNGHGTHCIGTACGPLSPGDPNAAPGVPRYGIAYNADIFVGKVLSNSGNGSLGGILQGMNWAIANGCEVISMSLRGLGGPVAAYTAAASRALNAGCLVIAASGNDSTRPFNTIPTGTPANSPGVVAVAALDNRLDVASFSNGGKIEIAAPGVSVFSSMPRPRMYGSISGTSMATPHVAGIAALLAESNPALRASALMQALTNSAQGLPQPASDVGAGLVQAP